MNKVLIKLEDVSKSYRNSNKMLVKVLHKVNLELNEGDFISIIGPSGCGKTTLLNLVGCLLKPTSGRVTFAGKDLAMLKDREMARLRNENIGFIFQGSYLIPTLNILENILLPFTFRQHSRRKRASRLSRAISLAMELGLEERLNYLPHQLSLGQRRRVAIARALLNEPLLLLADEPTNDLDPDRSAQIAAILNSLNHQKKMTMMLVTHQKEMANLAKRQFSLKSGFLQELVCDKQAAGDSL